MEKVSLPQDVVAEMMSNLPIADLKRFSRILGAKGERILSLDNFWKMWVETNVANRASDDVLSQITVDRPWMWYRQIVAPPTGGRSHVIASSVTVVATEEKGVLSAPLLLYLMKLAGINIETHVAILRDSRLEILPVESDAEPVYRGTRKLCTIAKAEVGESEAVYGITDGGAVYMYTIDLDPTLETNDVTVEEDILLPEAVSVSFASAVEEDVAGVVSWVTREGKASFVYKEWSEEEGSGFPVETQLPVLRVDLFDVATGGAALAVGAFWLTDGTADVRALTKEGAIPLKVFDLGSPVISLRGSPGNFNNGNHLLAV